MRSWNLIHSHQSLLTSIGENGQRVLEIGAGTDYLLSAQPTPGRPGVVHMKRIVLDTDVPPYSEDVARKWGELSGFALRRGRPRPANDTWIAACCLVYELPLATLNVKDFADFAEHHGLVIVAM